MSAGTHVPACAAGVQGRVTWLRRGTPRAGRCRVQDRAWQVQGSGFRALIVQVYDGLCVRPTGLARHAGFWGGYRATGYRVQGTGSESESGSGYRFRFRVWAPRAPYPQVAARAPRRCPRLVASQVESPLRPTQHRRP